jgi:biotin transporter BioY
MRIVGWAVLGLIAGGAIAFALGLIWLTWINTDNREGAAAMGVVFFITPAGAIVGAVAGGMTGAFRRR